MVIILLTYRAIRLYYKGYIIAFTQISLRLILSL